jgi:hypothetical protein
MSDVHQTARNWGRIGGLIAWSRNDAATMTGAAHRGFRARFEREVDPEGKLDPAERAARAERARRAYMLSLAARSAKARRKKTCPTNEASGQVTTEGQCHVRPSS